MRKFKLLMLALMATCGLSVNAADLVVGQRFTSVEDLAGKQFTIVNESEGKAVYNSDNQNLKYDTYAIAVTGASYQWILESAGDADPNVAVCYTLRAVKTDGSNVSFWGNNGPKYLNSGKPDGFNGCFILGNGEQYGTDFQYGGVWEVNYVEGSGFTLKNKGIGGYFKGVNSRPDSTDPVYWTFCTLIEDPLAAVQEKYNTLKTKYLEIADFDVTAIDAMIASATTVDDVQNAISALISAFEDYLATVEDETNMTSFIVNPSFETGNTNGWTYEGSNDAGAKENSNGTYTIENADGAYVFNIWSSGNLISQTIEDLPNGNYKMMALIATDADHQVKLSANGKSTTVDSYGGNDSKKHGVDGTVEFQVLDNTATIGAEGVNKYWYKVDNFRLFYTGPITDLTPYAESLAEAVTNATIDESTIPAAAYEALQAVLTAYNKEWSTVDEYNAAIEAINAAGVTARTFVAPYAAWKEMKVYADDIAAVEYTEMTAGSHDTFTAALSTQQNAVTNATEAIAVTAATVALKDALTAYINAAEPKNDGEYFNITFLMTNPNFDDSHNGWTYKDAPGVNWSNCEYYEKEFDINQTVTGLPTGSYSLSVQAFQRPGWAGNVYNDYINGIDNASSVLYINSITSNVKNIAADAQSTYKLGDGSNFGWPNDSRVGSEGSYKFVPNSQQGAKLWFEAGLYDAICAAVVTDEDGGSLKLGFKSTKAPVSGDWTIFDNFRLYYYGSSLLVYYKQYLPQLKSEASADLNNALYENVIGSERSEFEAALNATPASETEAAYQGVIDNIIEKQNNFRAAKVSYDAWVAYKAETVALFDTDFDVAAPTSAAEAIVAVQDLKIAQYDKVESDYPYSLTSKIGDFSTWEGTAEVGTPRVAGTPNSLDWEHWSGLTHPYYEQDGTGYDNEGGWTIKYTKTTTLPAGSYVVKVAARSSAGVTSKISCSAIATEISLPCAGNRARGIDKTGKASWSDSDEFILDNQGGGWEWRFMPFTLDAETEVTMEFYAEASSRYQWMSIADGELLSANNIATVVTYNEADENTIEDEDVANVTVTRNIKVGYNTVVLPFDLTLGQVEAAFGTGTMVYAFSENSVDADDATISFNKVNAGTISANVPVLVKATVASTSQTFEGIQIIAPTEDVKVAGTNFDFVGTYEPATIVARDYFIGNGAIYRSEGTTNIKAFRAYIHDKNPGGNARIVNFIIDGQETTGIEGLEIVNSNNNGKIYNLNGQQVKMTQKGLYIVNGKKVVVK